MFAENDYILEICVDGIESAINAEKGGADRIELCHGLEVGGLTPSAGLIRKVKEILDIPVFAMIRPRSGNFSYTDSELDQMEENIRVSLSLGINGFVLGALREDEIDKKSCQRLINSSNGLPVTFHRAFDLIPNPDQAVIDIINLGFKRILTSGQSTSAYEGRLCIKHLVEKFGSQIIIMPGCGINDKNLQRLKYSTKAKEYHSSGQLHLKDFHTENVVKGTTFHSVASWEQVKRLKNILQNCNAENFGCDSESL